MTKIIQLLASGYESIVDSCANRRDYVLPTKDGFVVDQRKLRGDVVNVGTDISKAMKVYGRAYRTTRSR